MNLLKVILIWTFVYCSPHLAFAYNPPAGYSDEFNKNIAIALSQSGVRGCGYLVWKKHPKQDGEYLVFCSRDGEDWRSYTVWLPSKKAQSGHSLQKIANTEKPSPNLAWSVTLCRSLGGMDAQTFVRKNATNESQLQLGMIVGDCKKFENGPYKATILKKTKKYVLVQIPSEDNIIGWTYSFNLIE
jgi:hypothetical protein